MGAGHTVTMLYEIIPVGVESSELRGSDGLKYQKTVATVNSDSREWATVKFRYKQPAGDKSVELSSPVTDRPDRLGMTSDNFRFSASVALWGMLLKDSEYKGNGNYRMVLNLGEQALGNDEDGYRSEYIRLVKSAQPLEKHLVAEER
jgi:Ca-activated chloride channel family protein